MRPKILHLKVVPVIQPVSFRLNRAFSLTWSASMQIYWRKESFQIRKEFNSHRIGLGPQHGRRFIVLEHQYGRREVMWKLSIGIRSLCNDDGDLNENGKKAIGLDWQDNNFAHASCFFCTFLCRHCTTTMWNVLIPPFLENMNTRLRLSFSFPELRYSLLEFNSRKNCQHLTNWTRRNKRYLVWSSLNSLFKWRFHSRRRRCCLSSLLISWTPPLKNKHLVPLPMQGYSNYLS